MAPISANTIIYAAAGGFIPTLLWLWFWLRETRAKGRGAPSGLIIFTFIFGMIAVILVIPFQKLAQSIFFDQKNLIIAWAVIEEVAKYLAVATLALHSKHIEKPIDYVLYFIVAGLGFAAMENILFLIKPFASDQVTVGLLTGQLRFLGSTVLHAIASGIIGISLGLVMSKTKSIKFLNLLFGLSTAVALHSVFNFFIMKEGGDNTLQVFGFLWVVVVLVLLLIEKLRRMSGLIE